MVTAWHKELMTRKQEEWTHKYFCEKTQRQTNKQTDAKHNFVDSGIGLMQLSDQKNVSDRTMRCIVGEHRLPDIFNCPNAELAIAKRTPCLKKRANHFVLMS